MKKNYILFTLFIISITSFSQNIFISEINTTDGVELTGPEDFNLNNWSIEVYNQNGTSEGSISFTAGDNLPTGAPYTAKSYSITGISSLSSFAIIFGASRLIVLRNGTVVTNAVRYGNTSYGFTNPSGVSGIIPLGINSPTSPNSYQYISGNGWIGLNPKSPNALNVGETLSIVKNNIEGFKMYPNPVSNGQLNISSDNWADKHIEIFNITGQQLYNKEVTNKETINISNLNKGTYMVRINEEGKIATRKLIIN